MKLLQQKLREAVGIRTGSLPTKEAVADLFEKWLPIGLINCRAPDQCSFGACVGRCSASYWRNHDQVVATLMSKFAKVLGQDSWLYYVTGAVHDLDYVVAPHDRTSAELLKSHPLPITQELIRMNFPPLVCLAVLEHAPHLKLVPSSSLTHALVACGDSVTLAAANLEICWPTDLPRTLVEILNTAPRGQLHDPSVNLKRSHRIFDSLRSLSLGTQIDWSKDRVLRLNGLGPPADGA